MRRLIVLLALCAAAAPLAAPAAAAGGPRQESTFQDDNELIYVPYEELVKNLDTLRALGVDRVRVTVLWKIVAPTPADRTRPPGFDATDPDAYPPGAWNRYDVLVREARARGIGVNFNVTGPSPLWANQVAPREDIVETFEPSAQEFGDFVTAVGRRYSGQWAGPGPDGRIPRVSYWSIWNEPNHSGWLTPQWSADSRSAFVRAASLYRELLGAAWRSLHATGHGQDTIIIGETAPKGDRSRGIKRYVEALTFVRALYCVDRRGRPLNGRRAGELSCPANPADFPAAHPVLFAATGYAHHPYELVLPPSRKPARPNWVTIANLPRLARTLDRIFRSYGSRRRMPLYLTEYGYQTYPPDPAGVTYAQQSAYLNESEYLAWRDRRVRTLAQFLLMDDDLAVPASFQSGLVTRDGRKKPAYHAYRSPIWIARPHVRRGRSVRVWALLRAAQNGRPASARIQFRRAGSRRWRTLKRVTTRDPRNYLQSRVRVPGSGHLRVRYTPPGRERPVSSRGAFVRVRPDVR